MTDYSNNGSTKFVNFILSNMEKNRGMRARLRRADNPTNEVGAWEYLARFVDLHNHSQRRAFALVAAALAKSKQENTNEQSPEAEQTPRKDGTHSLGKALAGIYEPNKQEPAKARLRRILSCQSLDELCDVLRPILGLITKENRYPLSYSRLLTDLLWFEQNQRAKEQWAQDFFSTSQSLEDTENSKNAEGSKKNNEEAAL